MFVVIRKCIRHSEVSQWTRSNLQSSSCMSKVPATDATLIIKSSVQVPKRKSLCVKCNAKETAIPASQRKPISGNTTASASRPCCSRGPGTSTGLSTYPAPPPVRTRTRPAPAAGSSPWLVCRKPGPTGRARRCRWLEYILKKTSSAGGRGSGSCAVPAGPMG